MGTVYTAQDLKVMQAWPLQKKIQVTQGKIMEWYYHYKGNVAVNFSGGKDSCTLLDLARRVFPDIKAVFVNTGMEYPSIKEFVASVPNVTWLTPEIPFHKVIEQYGYPVISKEVSLRIYYARKGSAWAIRHLQGLNKDGTQSKFYQRYVRWAYLINAPFSISAQCCTYIKERPLDKFTKETGLMPIIGTMASESMRRQMAYLITGCNAFDKRRPSSQPMSFWIESDVLAYLSITKIPYADIYGDIVLDKGKLVTTGAKRTGCMFCMLGAHREKPPNRFQHMEALYPKLHDYCINKLGCGKVLDYLNVPYNA